MDAFDALGDPVRRLILLVLSAGEQSAGAVVTAVRAHSPISQPAVSQHLRVLREAGLVAVRPEGARRLYRLDADGLEAARAWLGGLLDPLGGLGHAFDALGTEVARGKRARVAGVGGVRSRRHRRADRLSAGQARPSGRSSGVDVWWDSSPVRSGSSVRSSDSRRICSA
ncbi:metalloregulator ArsR/SmtB family transcription factor [Nocardioides sp. TF02-7]|uniref:ArsR/SmtB family transcription factor n=1 Tax=Nocardioides sp. TF02-7 TaxID=2917724 RepID=UPI001F05A61D|nr:metalloregulator ArsR/SmtB family transcription factor [Nocardioides sp. TF02-7]UMG92530.1 metalloregulator ArsR/SmtB family transcription factor [Nocardioides sp. TF02-7]